MRVFFVIMTMPFLLGFGALHVAANVDRQPQAIELVGVGSWLRTFIPKIVESTRTVPPRRPGESQSDYAKRIGKDVNTRYNPADHKWI